MSQPSPWSSGLLPSDAGLCQTFRTRYQLSVRAAAAFLDVWEITWYRWECGSPIPGTLRDRLVYLQRQSPATIWGLLALCDQ